MMLIVGMRRIFLDHAARGETFPLVGMTGIIRDTEAGRNIARPNGGQKSLRRKAKKVGSVDTLVQEQLGGAARSSGATTKK
jgi:hypothetical protein